MLVVDARDTGRGRMLVVEPDVLDRALFSGPGAIIRGLRLVATILCRGQCF